MVVGVVCLCLETTSSLPCSRVNLSHKGWPTSGQNMVLVVGMSPPLAPS